MAAPAPTAQNTTSDRKDVQGDEMWIFGFFSCFDEWRVCMATFCCPCYTIGRNATFFKEDGVMVGGLYLLGCGLGFGPLLRWRTRQTKNIRGTMLGDVLAHFLCPCCALIQENKELYGLQGAHIGEKIPLSVEMSRE